MELKKYSFHVLIFVFGRSAERAAWRAIDPIGLNPAWYPSTLQLLATHTLRTPG